MENKNNSFPQDDNWLEDILNSQTPEQEAPQDAVNPILKDSWSGRITPEQEEQYADATHRYTPAEEDAVYSEEVKPEKKNARQAEEDRGTRPASDKENGILGILASIPHVLVSLIWLAIALVIGVSMGRLIWTCCSDLMAFGKPDQAITITITEKEAKKRPDGTKDVDIESIAQKLEDAGLIENPDLFTLFATLTGKDQDISAGTYTLNSYFDYNAMINGMSYSAPAREIVTVMIPEGYNCAQIFALLEENEVCSARDLEAYAADGELDDYWFLEGVPRGSKYCLEGYLFPDTYDFYTNDDPERVLEKFLDDFDYRFTDLMREDFTKMQERYGKMLASHGYGSEYISQNPLTMHQLITLASIVEKESSSGSESFDVASVFYNRLTNAKEFPFLDSDATVLYAIGDYFGTTKQMTNAQLQTASPYNTRTSKGLPPGPICNPGIYSLYAVLDPNDTSYYYFVLDTKAGQHVFTRTYAEHQQKLKELGYT